MERLVAFLVAMAALLGHAAAQDSRSPRLGILTPTGLSVASMRQHVLPELARRGFAEGENLDVVWGVGSLDRMDALARDLAAARPQVVIAVSDFAIQAMHAADPQVPIVMSFIGSDPVAAGYAATLARPGGRVTGQMMLSHEFDAKRLELLNELAPSAQRIAVLRYAPPRHDVSMANLAAAARRLGLTLEGAVVGPAGDYDEAIRRARESGAQALLVMSAPGFARDAPAIARAGTRLGLPTMCEWDFMAREGCLAGYGPSVEELRLRTAFQVAEILRGTPPGDLPIEGPTQFRFVLNLQTARALDFVLPRAVLARADETVE